MVEENWILEVKIMNFVLDLGLGGSDVRVAMSSVASDVQMRS